MEVFSNLFLLMKSPLLFTYIFESSHKILHNGLTAENMWTILLLHCSTLPNKVTWLLIVLLSFLSTRQFANIPVILMSRKTDCWIIDFIIFFYCMMLIPRLIILLVCTPIINVFIQRHLLVKSSRIPICSIMLPDVSTLELQNKFFTRWKISLPRAFICGF